MLMFLRPNENSMFVPLRMSVLQETNILAMFYLGDWKVGMGKFYFFHFLTPMKHTGTVVEFLNNVKCCVT